MEEADKDWMMIRMVGGRMFLLVAAHPGSHGQTAVKRSLCYVCGSGILNISAVKHTGSVFGSADIAVPGSVDNKKDKTETSAG